MRIEQRTTGIAWIDGRISLDRAFNLPVVLSANRPLQAADDAGRQGPIKSERIADRQDFLSDYQMI